MDFVRTDSLVLLTIIFVAVTLLVARWKGLASVVSMALTFLLIMVFVLPKLADGVNPVLIALVASALIIPVTFYLSHGVNKKTTAAILASWITLLFTGFLAYIFINLGKLSGTASDEAATLSTFLHGTVNMKGLLLAGFIIGTLGILDDITISQAAIVEALAKTTKHKLGHLYSKGMEVGRDHISSNVNTLILVYAGTSLPLMLIFIDNPHPFSEVVNYEFIAEAIIRTLVGSIGLVIAVPVTTLIAAWFYSS